MASRRIGKVTYKNDLSPQLTVFRLEPETGSSFPTYQAGQYIALGRDDARLMKKAGFDRDGRSSFVPDIDARGEQRLGPVIHSYSVASAPWETVERGFLEFYVAQEVSNGRPGRLSTVLLGMECCVGEPVNYVDRITGSFTLDKLVDRATRIIMVGTGTGLAPFVSMIKQLHHAGGDGRTYTLLHTNRTSAELGYHQTLLDVEASGSFDFLHIPTISRPIEQDIDQRVGSGRATNVLRLLYGLPMRKVEDSRKAPAGSSERAEAEATLARTPRPTLPATIDPTAVRDRVEPGGDAVMLVCGNPASTTDIQRTAGRVGVRVEAEVW